MILFQGEYYDLRTHEDREYLKSGVYKYIKFSTDYDINICNVINKDIYKGDERLLINNKYNLPIVKVNKDMALSKVLAAAGYEVETTIRSNTIYVHNDKGLRYRFSDHKARRNYCDRYVNYTSKLIPATDLIKQGFSKVNPTEEYFLM